MIAAKIKIVNQPDKYFDSPSVSTPTKEYIKMVSKRSPQSLTISNINRSDL